MKIALVFTSYVCMIASMIIKDFFLFSISVVSVISSIILLVTNNKTKAK